MQSSSGTMPFGEDFTNWRETADALLAADSSQETKMMVVQHLQKIQTFLQRGLEQEEDTTEEVITKELADIERLKDRIQKSRERQDSSGSSLEDVLLLYDSLGMNEWQQIFDALIARTADTEQTILENLIFILQTIYGHCQKKHGQTQKDMLHQIYHPAETKKMKVPSKIPEELEDAISTCQVDVTTATLPKFFEAASGEIINNNRKIRDLLTNPKVEREVTEAYAAYFDKSLEFCLLLALALPTIDIVDKPKKAKNKKVQQLMQARNPKITSKEFGKQIFVKWPALVQGDRVIRPLGLYLLGSGTQARRDREYLEEHERITNVVEVQPEKNKLVRNIKAIDTI